MSPVLSLFSCVVPHRASSRAGVVGLQDKQVSVGCSEKCFWMVFCRYWSVVVVKSCNVVVDVKIFFLKSHSVQWFASVRFLVQPTFAALHHVDKVGERFLLVHRDVPEMTTHCLCELGLVESWSGLEFVVSLVASQCVHLQLEKVDLRNLDIVIRRLSSVVARLPLSLIANTLDEVLVEVADVEVAHTLVNVEFEFLLGYTLLDPLAEGGVSSRAAASLPVLNQATALSVKRWRRGTIVTVLLRTEPIHPALQSRLVCQSPNKVKNAVNTAGLRSLKVYAVPFCGKTIYQASAAKWLLKLS